MHLDQVIDDIAHAMIVIDRDTRETGQPHACRYDGQRTITLTEYPHFFQINAECQACQPDHQRVECVGIDQIVEHVGLRFETVR